MNGDPQAVAHEARAYYDALVGGGFSPDAAIALLCAWGPPPTRVARRPRPQPRAKDIPEGFPDRLRPHAREVLTILRELARDTAAEGVTVPTPRSVALALMDFPDRDWIAVAREYRAWQLGDRCRHPHRDVARGYRAQLKAAPPVARPTRPGGGQRQPTEADRRAAQRRALEEAEA